jgi:type IV pilus assembly protein PilC
MTSATSTKTRTYDYEALDAAGKRTKGKVEAATDSAAAAALRAQGVVPLKLSESGRGLQKELKIPGLGDRVKVKDLAVLARQFATMTSSGLSLLRSLAILEEQTPNQKLATALRDVRRDIEGGTSLSGALGKQDRIFPRLMIAMIAAGETGGFLDQALDRIAINFEKDATLRGKIKSAMTYPMLVVGFSILMLVAVLIFIVPVFEHMFANLGGQLPLPTRILVVLSHQIWWVFPVTVAVLIAFVSWFRKKLHDDPAWRLGFDRFKLRLPVFGSLFAKIAISRFARNLGTLLHVGVPIMQALDIVGATTGNAVIAEAMTDVRRSVRDGQTMSAPLERHPIFPSMVTNMMQVGEETGQMSAMLDKVSDFYDGEVEAATEALTAAIEPIMVVVMGSIIGVMVICLYLPMFTIYQHVQGAS